MVIDMNSKANQQPRIGLALGSGSSRGWAHIGVLEALDEAGIPIHVIAGTSIGAYVGGVYAAGGLERLKEFALNMDWRKVLSYVDVVFPRSGFLDGKKVTETFPDIAGVEEFDALQIPLQIVAADLFTGEEVLLDHGKLVPAIRASISVPGVLTPVRRGDRWLVDGGVVNPLPVSVVKAMGAELIIAVDLNSDLVGNGDAEPPEDILKKDGKVLEKKRLEVIQRWMDQYAGASRSLTKKIDQWFSREEPSPHILEVMSSSLNIMQQAITQTNLHLHQPDILIQPQLGDLKMFDFDEAQRSIHEGYQRTVEQLPHLLDLLARIHH